MQELLQISVANVQRVVQTESSYELSQCAWCAVGICMACRESEGVSGTILNVNPPPAIDSIGAEFHLFELLEHQTGGQRPCMHQ